MQLLDDTTYRATPTTGHLDTVIGDEKQTEFYPRIKIKGWDNEVNLSVGVIHDETPHTMTQEGNKVIWEQGDTTASFEPLIKTTIPDNHISLIDEGEITPQRIAAEYEVDRYFNWGQTIRIHKSNQKAMMYYGFYNANEFVDRSKLDIPEVRLSVANWNDPMTMNNQLVLIDVHYDKDRDDQDKIQSSTINAVTEVLAKYGVKVYQKLPNIYKLYYKDGNKDVKFLSTGFFSGHYYYYINLGHDYNGALAYSNDPNPVPRNDTHAYGLPATLPSTVITEIIARYAELYGLPLVPRVFTPAEEAKIAEIEAIHNNENWIVNGKRDDVWRLTADEQNEDGFEFDITLATKPDTNVYTMSIETKGLIFGKQKAIADDKTKTEYRSPRVVGSYAVYHESKKNNEYKAGKAFHIYRPIIKDATGKEVWGDLDIDTEMRIIIPQDFIDNATYPIIIDPTFGYTVAGASNVAFQDVIVGTVQTLSETAIAISMNAYVGTWAGITTSYSLEMAVYDTSGNWLTDTHEASGTDIGVLGWKTQTMDLGSYRLSATDYILAVWGDSVPGLYSSAMSIAYDSVPGTSKTYASNYVADTWPTGISFANETGRQYSIYLEYFPLLPFIYKWPIMVGSSISLPAADRYSALMADNTAIKSSTESLLQSLVPAPANYNNFRYVLGTAPGGAESRIITLRGTNGSIGVTITGAATSGSDTTNWESGVAGNTINIFEDASSAAIAVSALQRWRLDQYGDNQQLYSVSTANLSTTATRYMGVQDSSGLGTSAPAGTQIMPEEASLRNFYFKLNGTLVAGSYKATLWVNGAPTAATATLTDDGIYSYSDLIYVAFNDTIYWQITPSTPTAPSNARAISISCEYVSERPGNGILLGGANANASNSATVYNNWYGLGGWNATETNVQALAGTIQVTKLHVKLSAAAGVAKSRLVALRNAGVSTAASVTVSENVNTTGTWTGSVVVSQDALINVIQTPTGTPTASSVKYGIVFNAIPTTAPQMMMMGIG